MAVESTRRSSSASTCSVFLFHSERRRSFRLVFLLVQRKVKVRYQEGIIIAVSSGRKKPAEIARHAPQMSIEASCPSRVIPVTRSYNERAPAPRSQKMPEII